MAVKLKAHDGYIVITEMEGIKSCFEETSIQKYWSENDKIYIAITEDSNWWQNKCILRDWFFDYEKFKTLDMHMDCESYGVFVFWPKDTEDSTRQTCNVCGEEKSSWNYDDDHQVICTDCQCEEEHEIMPPA